MDNREGRREVVNAYTYRTGSWKMIIILNKLKGIAVAGSLHSVYREQINESLTEMVAF